MKILKNVLLLMITLLFFNYSVIAQEEEEEIEEVVEEIPQGSRIIQGTFDGFDGESYSFNYKDEEGEDDVFFFTKIVPEVLKTYDLKGNKFEGKAFEITFISETETEIDEDGDEQEYTRRTIIGLKPIK
ncbi:hypothetical protein [Aquimarina macrocephali]|uniref:hypothetical protein n=1 Tax=Aquimarina macrocephali TaxID=666563 RepID=UPI003F67B883